MPELTNFINQMDLEDTDRTFHPNTKERIFVSEDHKTFSKIGHNMDTKQLSIDVRKMKEKKENPAPFLTTGIKAGYQ